MKGYMDLSKSLKVDEGKFEKERVLQQHCECIHIS